MTRLADATNWQVGLEGFIRKSGLLEGYCAEIDRPFEEITRTHGPDCRLFDTEADLQRWLATPSGGHLWGSASDDEYVTTMCASLDSRTASATSGKRL